MSKLRKKEILDLLKDNATLIRKFDRMYGVYFFIICSDNNCIYNLHKSDCASITKMLQKNIVDANTFEYTYNN